MLRWGCNDSPTFYLSNRHASHCSRHCGVTKEMRCAASARVRTAALSVPTATATRARTTATRAAPLRRSALLGSTVRLDVTPAPAATHLARPVGARRSLTMVRTCTLPRPIRPSRASTSLIGMPQVADRWQRRARRPRSWRSSLCLTFDDHCIGCSRCVAQFAHASALPSLRGHLGTHDEKRTHRRLRWAGVSYSHAHVNSFRSMGYADGNLSCSCGYLSQGLHLFRLASPASSKPQAVFH